MVWLYSSIVAGSHQIQSPSFAGIPRSLCDLFRTPGSIRTSIPSNLFLSLVHFEKWSASRLLPPQAVRRALEPCSKKKVDEAKQEYPAFKTWVDDKLPKYPPADLRTPFAVEQFGMAQPTVRILEEMGWFTKINKLFDYNIQFSVGSQISPFRIPHTSKHAARSVVPCGGLDGIYLSFP